MTHHWYVNPASGMAHHLHIAATAECGIEAGMQWLHAGTHDIRCQRCMAAIVRLRHPLAVVEWDAEENVFIVTPAPLGHPEVSDAGLEFARASSRYAAWREACDLFYDAVINTPWARRKPAILRRSC